MTATDPQRDGRLAGRPGRLYGLGVGPGDPELLTLRAVRVLRSCPVVAYVAARGRKGNARCTVEGLLHPEQVLERLEYPVTVEPVGAEVYRALLDRFHDDAAERLATHLDAGHDVAVLSEGDPLFYGSYMHLHVRLSGRFRAEVVPGITSVSAAGAAAGMPLVSGDERFTVVTATMPPEDLKQALAGTESVVILKIGRHLDRVVAALEATGRIDHAVYVERASHPDQLVVPVREIGTRTPPYFSLVLVPGPRLAGPSW
ncbi:precorrin-2 C(20)-methyltransferase [Rhabdothermincola sp.]|uniref:precorrin-2 C(20)-methyltransferase n=1 Tax=Rhabdothermincola sp. TaxID=2820405 RepID=UPI002FE4025D